MKKRSYKSSIILVAFACIGILIACGPSYSPRVLSYRSTVIEVPATSIELMFPKNKKESNAHRHYRNLPKRQQATLKADIEDLKKADPKLDVKILEQYSAIRKKMIISNGWNIRPANQAALDWLDVNMQKALPKEFSLYHTGAVAYRSGLIPKARDSWLKLLKLPIAERRYRSTWAAWMLARSSSEDGEGTRWYKKLLELKEAGFPDSLGVTEKDWTSYFAYRSGDYITALSSYINDGKKSAIDAMEAARSIDWVFQFALEREKEKGNLKGFYQMVARDKEHSIAFSYFLKNKHSPWGFNENGDFAERRVILSKWIEELIRSEREDKDKELGINATTSYALHDDELLQLCISRIIKPTIDTLWLKAKHETFEGDLTEASKTYVTLTKMIQSEGGDPGSAGDNYYGNYSESGDTAQRRLFWLYSEYASVELGLKNYGRALDLFVDANNYADAAYIAETLMSPIELLHHVRGSEVAKKSQWLKNLLSRKLIRNEYFKDAKPFILEEHIKKYEEYIALYRSGLNQKNSKKDRSEALEKAAHFLYRNGRPLISIEYRARPFSRVYAAGMKMHRKYDYSEHMETEKPHVPAITADELARIKKNYIRISPIRVKTMEAAEILYRAAMLLPKNDDHAAELFWRAGDWTRADPQIADKYYQTLVRRCWNTKLGKACDERRWFIHNIRDL